MGPRQTEAVYNNKVSKVMQETESVLRQVHVDLDEADRARHDLLAFQLKKKKLTWVPDQLVFACQAQGCGRVRRACGSPALCTHTHAHTLSLTRVPQVFEQRVRKHHCRCCGRVFCRACSRERAAIPSLNFTSPVRVCDSCSLLLLPGNPANPFPGSAKAAAGAGESDDDGGGGGD
jgi:hypothetical protein